MDTEESVREACVWAWRGFKPRERVTLYEKTDPILLRTTLPHWPQLLLSVRLETHCPPHVSLPAPVHVDPHTPLVHGRPDGHVLPHAPQFLGSDASVTHAPEHCCCPFWQTH